MGDACAPQNDAESRRAAAPAAERPCAVALFGRRVARARFDGRLLAVWPLAVTSGAVWRAAALPQLDCRPPRATQRRRCSSRAPCRFGRFGSLRWSARIAAKRRLARFRRVPPAHSSRVARRRACGGLWALRARRLRIGVSLVTIARRIARRQLAQFGALGVGCCYTAGRACSGRFAPLNKVRFHSTRRLEAREKCYLVARGTTSQAANGSRHSLRRASDTGAALHFIRSAHSRAATASRKKRQPVQRAKMVTRSRTKPTNKNAIQKSTAAPHRSQKTSRRNIRRLVAVRGAMASAKLKISSAKFAYKNQNPRQSNKKRRKITAQAVYHPAAAGLRGKFCQPTKAADTRCSSQPNSQTSRRQAAP